MAKTVVFNHTDSGVSGVTTLTLDKAIINYGADYRVKTQDTDNVILTNMTSPIEKPETYRLAVSPIKDIYKGTNIDPSLYASSRRGVSVLCALQGVWTVTDSEDSAYQVDLPVSAHLVMKVPSNENISPAMVEDFLGRLLAGLYESGSADTSRIGAILRGSLKPTEL